MQTSFARLGELRAASHSSHENISLVKKVMGFALCIVGLSVLIVPAAGHDWWLNGEEVDPVLKLMCCGPNDTKLVDGLVRLSADGKSIYFNDRPSEIILLSRVQPSPDGHWWRSIDNGDEEKAIIRCVFGPYAY
jgi:hypothetical protein